MAGRNVHTLGGAPPKDPVRKGLEEFSQSSGSSSTSVLRPTHHQLIDQARALQPEAEQSEAKARNVAEIVVYANGFTVGGGAFRDAAQPQNAKFLEELKRREVPEELEDECRRLFGDQVRDVSVTLVNKLGEHFRPPPPKFDFASSQGRALGAAPPPPAAAAAAAAAAPAATPQELRVDEGKPTALLQVTLFDRQRLRVRANLGHTVLDLVRHVAWASKKPPAAFALLAGFPPRPLADPAATLEAAGLRGANVEQKLL